MPNALTHTCVLCGSPRPDHRLKYCSDACQWRAQYARRGRKSCEVCGGLMGWSAKDERAKAAVHPRCRPIEHGTIHAFRRRGCRCDLCREASNAAAREYAAKVRERDGISLSTKYGHSGGAFIKRAERLAIYERDGWTCQLCGEPVDPNAPRNSSGEATLDHVEPQTFALIPDHRPENLRMAHRGCNSSRGNRVA